MFSALYNNILSSVMNSSADGIILLNEQKRIILYNQNALKILQLPTMSIKGYSMFQIIQRDSFPSNLRNLTIPTEGAALTVTNYLEKKSDIILKISIYLDKNKSTKATLLSFTLQNTEKNKTLSHKNNGFSAHYTFDSILGSSSEIKSVVREGHIAAKSTSPVLILGESGTGKELIAQSIHNASNRAKGPFVSINCAAIPSSIIANEFFGSENGAFTGARKEGTLGKFELANGGTIFLDEIGDMSFELQAALLRVLQNNEITRLGGKSSIKVDVRVIAATNQDLIKAINSNSFRADLYYRLNVLNITMPPLRNRAEDIFILAHSFLKKYASRLNKQVLSISEDAISKLFSYHWPGNVRELENVMERAVNMVSGTQITAGHLPYYIKSASQTSVKPFETDNINKREGDFSTQYKFISPEIKERELILRSIMQEHGHVKSVAQKLNIPISTLYRKLTKYNIDPKTYKKWS